MEGITNEFNKDLVYTLSDEDGVVVSEKSLPTTNADKSYILTNIEIEAGVTKTYTLKIEYKYLDTPQNDYQGAEFKATLGIDNKKIERTIAKAYTYNQDSTASNYCVTGDEETCEETTCYESTTEGSCPAGTILNYKVNDTETVRFHVMYDNGETMTLQSQKNTVYNVEWINEADYATANTDGTWCQYGYDSCNDEGPITILNALESETSDWDNVNDQTYTLGTTTFKTNVYTGCPSYSSCDVNTYTLPERTAKARMITVQEAADLGCTGDNELCPIWMYNYLSKSTNYGGTINGAQGGYWTMNAYSSLVNTAWAVRDYGYVSYSNGVYYSEGARAVVEISK